MGQTKGPVMEERTHTRENNVIGLNKTSVTVRRCCLEACVEMQKK